MAIVQAVLVRHFTYRGSQEEYSSIYHLSGTQPANSAAWATVLGAIRDAEKPMLPSSVVWTDGYGYNAGSWETAPQTADAHVVWTSSNTGSYSPSTDLPMAGDAAFWVRWTTGDFSSTGKPIYLRKYFHPVYTTAGTPDNVSSGQRTAAAAYADKMFDGTTIAGGLKICRPGGTVGNGESIAVYATTRTLKRRGKRPNP